MLAEIFSILAPVFICAGIGLCWSKSGKSYDTELITAIVSYFGTPCLIFYSISAVEIAPRAVINMAGAALAANVAFIIIAGVFLALARLEQRAFLPTLSFPNVGNVGLPLCYLAFGEEGLALGSTFFAVYAVVQLTAGTAFVSGRFSPASLLKMPVIPATLLAVVFLLTATPVPAWLSNTTRLIGDLTIPLMLFTLGVSLSHIRLASLKIPFALAIMRLGPGFGVGLLLASLFQLESIAAGVVILQCSMPTAVFCYLFAQLYDRRPQDVAGAVMLSTLLSVITLPALLAFVLSL